VKGRVAVIVSAPDLGKIQHCREWLKVEYRERARESSEGVRVGKAQEG
jgi:hypothetical protein